VNRIGRSVGLVAPAVFALAAGAAAAGCSSGSSPTGATTTSSTTASSTTRADSSSTTSTSSTTIAGVTRCVASNLSGRVAGSQGGAGTFEVTIALRNTATTSCTTGGYPGLQLLNGSGTAIPTTTVRGGPLSFEKITPATLTVPAGGTVWFNVGYSDVPTGGATTCPVAASIQIIPPNDTTHLTVSGLQANVCNNGTLDTSPLFGPGSPGTQTTAPPAQ
jgi:hypothetical protein